jgi:hypothetical protein
MNSINLFTKTVLSYLNKEGLDALWRTSSKTRAVVREFDQLYSKWQAKVLCVLHGVGEQFAPVLDEELRTLLQKHSEFDPHATDYRHVEHIAYVTEELRKDDYSSFDKKLILRSLLTMTLPFPSRGYGVTPPKELVDLADGIRGKGTVQSMYLEQIGVLVKDGQSIAKVMLKAGSSLLMENPGIRKYSREKIDSLCAAYELMRSFGIQRVAPTFRLKDGNAIQQFINESQVLFAILKEKDGAQKLLKMHSSEVQLHVLGSLLTGVKDGHDENTVLTCDAEGYFHPHDIDEEYSFTSRCVDVKDDSGSEGKGPVLVMAGLPQCALPISPAIKRLFGGSWFDWKARGMEVMKRNGLVDVSRLSAFQERCLRIHALCMCPAPTPRDAYFSLYGKDYSYQLACKTQMPPLRFFEFGVEANDTAYADDDVEFVETWASIVALTKNEKEKVFRFPMERQDYEDFPGDALKSQLLLVQKEDCVDCMEIPKDAFDEKLYQELLKRHPQITPGFHSFLLSLCLEGFAKRMTRQFAEPGSIFLRKYFEITTDTSGNQKLVMRSKKS